MRSLLVHNGLLPGRAPQRVVLGGVHGPSGHQTLCPYSLITLGHRPNPSLSTAACWPRWYGGRGAQHDGGADGGAHQFGCLVQEHVPGGGQMH